MYKWKKVIVSCLKKKKNLWSEVGSVAGEKKNYSRLCECCKKLILRALRKAFKHHVETVVELFLHLLSMFPFSGTGMKANWWGIYGSPCVTTKMVYFILFNLFIMKRKTMQVLISYYAGGIYECVFCW